MYFGYYPLFIFILLLNKVYLAIIKVKMNWIFTTTIIVTYMEYLNYPNFKKNIMINFLIVLII